MVKSVLFIWILFLLNFQVIAQKFKSDFEKNNVQAIINDNYKINIDALLTLDDNINSKRAEEIKTEINEFIQKLDPEKLKTKSLKAIAKKVFTETHQQFFKKYELLASFDQIFGQKNYNCVSATALYAIIFNSLEIQYDLMWSPGHVYMIIKKGTEKITIESTDPINGYKTTGSSKNLKNDYINQMLAVKIISLDDYPGLSKEDIYNLLFEENKVISFSTLVAFQYQNKAVEYLAEQNYDKAINHLIISKSIYNDQTTRDILNLTYYSAIAMSQSGNSNPFKILHYLEGYVLNNDSIPEEFQKAVVSDICRLSYNIAIGKSAPDSLKNTYKLLQESYFSKYEIFTELRKCVNEEIVRYYYLKKEYKEVISPVIQAFSAEETNLVYRGTLLDVMRTGKYYYDDVDDYYDYGEEELDLNKGFNFLRNIIDSTCNSCACCDSIQLWLDFHFNLLATQEYAFSNDIEKANQYFEKVIQQQKMVSILETDEVYFGLCFKEMWAYYTRKQDYEKGNYYIDEGLKLYPDNKVLKSINKTVIKANKK